MKKNIALVTGGFSGEAVISYKSAESIMKNIDSEKWNCYLIDIQPTTWFHPASSGGKIQVDKNDFSIIINGEKILFEAALIALHGTPGEDGKLQGYFDCIHLPYTSCDAATSALTFNKRYTVAVASFAGLHVAKSLHLFRGDAQNASQVASGLKMPVFVKPNNGGSSIGMSKVSELSGLEVALEKAFNEDSQVLVEEFIRGREFTIGVFKTKEKIVTLPITEIITKNDFFDFQAKYEGASEEITPANVDDHIANSIRAHAEKAYAVFNCKGIVRIDFIYDAQKELPFLLEINTVPGQSAASIIPMQVNAMGWNLKDFYSTLIEACFN